MSLKGKLTSGLFCSTEIQQKTGCLSWVLEDGKNLDTQMEWDQRAFQARGGRGGGVEGGGRNRLGDGSRRRDQ